MYLKEGSGRGWGKEGTTNAKQMQEKHGDNTK